MAGYLIIFGTVVATGIVLAILAEYSRRQEQRERDAHRS